MSYEETIDYLFNAAPLFQNIGSQAYKEGLSNTLALDEYFEHPHKLFKTVHVAGTNGKGSCSHTLASILQASGLKVGLFTSPHLIDFRERIRVNGKMIDKEYVIDFVDKHRSFFEPLHPSFFELTTAMAFKFFADQQVDVAVIEVGLGGRLDCTNIISPELCVITNISFDHVALLGDSLAKIATEKAGIIKHNIPVVIGETNDEIEPVFNSKALEMNAPILYAEKNNEILSYFYNNNHTVEYKTNSYGYITGELCGFCQQKNTNTILNAVKLLRNRGFAVSDENVKDGFSNVCENTGLMGRWQTIQDRPFVVCDTGHNVGGFEWISKQLSILSDKSDTLRIVFGMVNDKDISGVLAMLPKDAKYYFCQASVKRALPSDEIAKLSHPYGLIGSSYPTVHAAYEAALSESAENDAVYVGGSSFVVADFLTFLSKK